MSTKIPQMETKNLKVRRFARLCKYDCDSHKDKVSEAIATILYILGSQLNIHPKPLLSYK